MRIRLAELAGAPDGDRAPAHPWRAVPGDPGTQGQQGVGIAAGASGAGAVGVEPGPGQPPDAWDALADAYQGAGELAKAAAAADRAADLAAAAGQAAAAAGYRLRAGPTSSRPASSTEADAALSRVADDPAAGPIRARAGMLRALARGRALASQQPGASSASYAEALERQIRDFPADPTTDEARWLLGELAGHLGVGPRSSPPALVGHPLRLAPMARRPAGHRRPGPRRARPRADQPRPAAASPSRSPPPTSSWPKASVRRAPRTPCASSSWPGPGSTSCRRAGRPEAAKDLCDRVARLPVSPAVLYRSRLLRMLALVELGRYIEAEREAQTHPDWYVPSEAAALFDAVRLLDQGATIAATDLRQRRFGLVLKLLLESVLTLDQKFSTSQLIELKMRMTRALLFVGDDREARRSLSAWRGSPDPSSDRLLRDLGDTYSRLEVYSLDIDVQRLRLQNNPAGSMAWFDARYALALAYYHTGQYKDAAQLIDATAILHPELGGGELHEKFIRPAPAAGREAVNRPAPHPIGLRRVRPVRDAPIPLPMSERSDAMPVTVHHQPVDPSKAYTLHAWIGTTSSDAPGTRRGDVVDFQLPDLGDLRRLRFKFFSTDARSHVDWESDGVHPANPLDRADRDLDVRAVRSRPLPGPDAAGHRSSGRATTLTFHVITQNRFIGGKLYAWNPFVPGGPNATLDQASRSDPVSTFTVRLQPWMTAGFHFKLIGHDDQGNPAWEPDSSNRVWSPGDGASLWIKSGQVSVRHRPLELKEMPVEVVYPASLTPPPDLVLRRRDRRLPADVSRGLLRADSRAARRSESPPTRSRSTRTRPTSSPRRRAARHPCGARSPPIPTTWLVTSRFALDADGWLPAFPVAVTETLSIEPVSPSSFPGGLTVEAGVANAVAAPDGGGRQGGPAQLGGTGHRPIERRELGAAATGGPEGAPPVPARALRRLDRHPAVLHAGARADDLFHPGGRVRRWPPRADRGRRARQSRCRDASRVRRPASSRPACSGPARCPTGRPRPRPTCSSSFTPRTRRGRAWSWSTTSARRTPPPRARDDAHGGCALLVDPGPVIRGASGHALSVRPQR